ncbi:catalase [Aquabacterium sp.]|uniref:catalase n=1 Tax=Aquabacterium sp. TaxID=1872578 RepID=UPI002C8C1283|nr:catalase [Aquabacterium sp.]HSW03025.1 catalase [Aquabacterium sp.]
MSSHTTASTDWQEHIAPDEAQRFERYAQQMVELQRRKSARHGNGRALHRKQIVAARGTLTVHANLPAFARHGLFAEPGAHEALVRLSNGGMDRAADKVPDVRGFAIKVLGVQGDSALGNGPATSQDFLLINQPKFAFPGSGEFVDFVLAASRGKGALLAYLLRRYGLIGGPRRLLRLLSSIGAKFSGYATAQLFSAVPIACGPYAVRLRLEPAAGNGDAASGSDFAADVSARLARQPLQWTLQLQPFTDERATPIEDASVNWVSPYTTVATLVLPQQDLASASGQVLQAQAEAGVFDPWQALAAHRPLGDVQRARKVIYFASQRERGAA